MTARLCDQLQDAEWVMDADLVLQDMRFYSFPDPLVEFSAELTESAELFALI